jgi:hypothetical protein
MSARPEEIKPPMKIPEERIGVELLLFELGVLAKKRLGEASGQSTQAVVSLSPSTA